MKKKKKKKKRSAGEKYVTSKWVERMDRMSAPYFFFFLMSNAET